MDLASRVLFLCEGITRNIIGKEFVLLGKVVKVIGQTKDVVILNTVVRGQPMGSPIRMPIPAFVSHTGFIGGVR
jgi:hypothetical protein